MTVPLDPPPSSRIRRPVGGRYAVALAATVVCWAALVGGLVYLIFARTAWAHQADQAHLTEWLDEARVFRKTIPDLVAQYIDLRDSDLPPALTEEDLARKVGEIREQLKSLTDPLRMYQGYLPLFPDVFRIEVTFPNTDWPPITPLTAATNPMISRAAADSIGHDRSEYQRKLGQKKYRTSKNART